MEAGTNAEAQGNGKEKGARATKGIRVERTKEREREEEKGSEKGTRKEEKEKKKRKEEKQQQKAT